jgi:phosphoribosylglycinamide formyltransferase-1
MRILTADFTRYYEGRLLNIHPSLLPKYQGLNTHQRALDAGDDRHGVTVHFVTEELDGGPNAIQAIVPILDIDNAQQLQARVHAQEHIIYPIAVKWFCEGRLTMKGNRALLDNKVLPITGVQLES